MSRHIRSTALYRAAVGLHRADGPRRGGPACENDWRGAGLSCVPIAPSSLAEVQRIEVCAVAEHTGQGRGAARGRHAPEYGVRGRTQTGLLRENQVARLVNFLLLVSACGALIAVAIAWLLWRGDF
jgi:hypothetical protein